MNHLSVLIKPASSLCNLRCRYCFYHDISENRDMPSYGVMAKETADKLIGNAVNSAGKSILFAFQGGEPTLAGIEYFRYFTERADYMRRNSGKNLKINYSVQTNGININDEWARFFKEHNFLAGLSLDGSKEINDFLRIDANGGETYGRIMKTAKLFDKYKVDYNILTVVTAQTAKHIEKIYNHYKNSGFMYLQFIPCLDPLDAPPFEQVYSLAPELYEKFLVNLFRLWYNDFMSGKYVSIRFFDNIVRIAAGEPVEQCGMTGICEGQFAVESDGGVFPCDFYCVDNWKTGSIFDMTFEELKNAPNMRKFRDTSHIPQSEAEKCRACGVYYLCRGGCRRDRDNKKDGTAERNIYCGALRNFYSFAEPYLGNIVKNSRIAGR